MKLAEALQERADLVNNIERLRSRIRNNALVQEGEEPAENPKELIKDVYGLNSKVITDPTSDAPMVIPIGKHSRELEACL